MPATCMSTTQEAAFTSTTTETGLPSTPVLNEAAQPQASLTLEGP